MSRQKNKGRSGSLSSSSTSPLREVQRFEAGMYAGSHWMISRSMNDGLSQAAAARTSNVAASPEERFVVCDERSGSEAAEFPPAERLCNLHSTQARNSWTNSRLTTEERWTRTNFPNLSICLPAARRKLLDDQREKSGVAHRASSRAGWGWCCCCPPHPESKSCKLHSL